MLIRCPLAIALLVFSGAADAAPPGAAPSAAASSGELRVRGEHRRLPPEMLERLRTRLPAGGSRASGRAARLRERAFDEAVKDPDGKGAEISTRMQELRASFDEIRRERRRAAHARWGKTADSAAAKEELALHGRRMAKIRRMQFLAVTERQGEKRDALLERLARLRDLERGRHERAMQVLAGGREPAAASAKAGAK